MNAPGLPMIGAKCKSCGAPIFFVRMKGSSSAMPIDQQSRRMVTLESGEGETLVAVMREAYTSHFVTCPNADQHRTSRRKGGR